MGVAQTSLVAGHPALQTINISDSPVWVAGEKLCGEQCCNQLGTCYNSGAGSVDSCCAPFSEYLSACTSYLHGCKLFEAQHLTAATPISVNPSGTVFPADNTQKQACCAPGTYAYMKTTQTGTEPDCCPGGKCNLTCR